MKEIKTTAQVLVDCLEAEGVDVMFGIPGEETLDLMFAIRDSKIRFIPVRHEQGAAFMADVYGRLTGRAGVCLSTLGPGATNLVTGVADAYLDGAPLVAITGQVGTDRMQLTSHQYLDLTAMFEPITKRSKQIIRPDTVGEIVRLAFKHAEKGKPGATHIDLPQNIAKMPADAVPLKRQQMHEVYAAPTHIAAAGKIISEAKNPVILAGAGAVRGHAAAAVTELADRLHIPVVNTMMAKGIIPMDDKYSLWTIGIPQKDYVNQLFDRADVVIAIGYDIVECAPAKWGARENMTIVHIDSAPADVNKRYQPAVEVVGNISESLYEILRCAHRTGEPEFALALRQTMVAEHEAMAADDSCPMKPARILADVRKVMGRDDIVVSDVGAHKMWIARHYDCYEPNTCLISNGFASMGFSIPGAFAAKLLYPEKKVLAVCGDGGFMMNSQELETAVREHVPFVTLIWEDSSYGLIKWKEQDQFGGLHEFACRKHVQLSGHHRLHTGRPRIQYIHGTPGMRLISCDVPTQDVIISRHGIARRPLTGSVRSAEARFGTRLEVRLCVTEGAQSVPTVNPRLFLTQYFLFHPFQIGTGVIQTGMCERSLQLLRLSDKRHKA